MDSSLPTSPDPTPENDDLLPEALQTDDDLSSGNSRLALIAGGIVAFVLAGYLLLPATITSRNNAPELPTPTMDLGEATITGTRTADEQEAALTPATATTDATATAASATAAPAKSAPARSTINRNTPATDEPADSNEPTEPALAPVAPAAAVVVEATELAPTTLKMNGRVLDENGQPLAGATIMLKGSKTATSTDAGGNYSLEVPAGTDNTLLYGYGGYEDQLLRSRNAKTQNITLLPKEGAKRRRR